MMYIICTLGPRVLLYLSTVFPWHQNSNLAAVTPYVLQKIGQLRLRCSPLVDPWESGGKKQICGLWGIHTTLHGCFLKNGGTPISHPKMIILSRKTHGCWVPPF